MFATETKEVKLYSYNTQGVFVGEFQYLWVAGTGLASHSTLVKPLEEKEGFLSVWDEDKWVYKENHIGKTVYNTETRESKIIDYVGEVRQGWTLLKPIEFGKWDGVSWTDNRTEEDQKEHERSLMSTLSPIEFDIKLVDAGLYDQVQDLIQSDIKLRIAYTRATFFSRLDPFVIQASEALKLTPEQVDEIWISK